MSSEIRDWARSQGMEVASRGLIPHHIIAAFKKAHGIGTTRYPALPPKPRIVKAGDLWLLDNGHAVILHDTWDDALEHAARICRDYRARAARWLSEHA